MDLSRLSDAELLERLEGLVAEERQRLPEILACLAEVDGRKSFARGAYSSVFDYCVRKLRFSEGEAYRRIHAARAAKRYPQIYSYLAGGEFNLSSLSLLIPQLNPENVDRLLELANGKSLRQVEEMVAGLQQQPEKPRDQVRPVKLASEEASQALGQGRLALPSATAPAEIAFEYRFTASREFREAFERVKDILWHRFPFGGTEEVLLAVLREYLARHRPDPPLIEAPVARRSCNSRRIPAWVRRKVWARDGGRCAFVGPEGRCQARRGLELDHVKPFSLGGKSDDPDNIRLLCREHNEFERRRIIGE